MIMRIFFVAAALSLALLTTHARAQAPTPTHFELVEQPTGSTTRVETHVQAQGAGSSVRLDVQIDLSVEGATQLAPPRAVPEPDAAQPYPQPNLVPQPYPMPLPPPPTALAPQSLMNMEVPRTPRLRIALPISLIVAGAITTGMGSVWAIDAWNDGERRAGRIAAGIGSVAGVTGIVTFITTILRYKQRKREWLLQYGDAWNAQRAR